MDDTQVAPQRASTERLLAMDDTQVARQWASTGSLLTAADTPAARPKQGKPLEWRFAEKPAERDGKPAAQCALYSGSRQFHSSSPCPSRAWFQKYGQSEEPIGTMSVESIQPVAAWSRIIAGYSPGARFRPLRPT